MDTEKDDLDVLRAAILKLCSESFILIRGSGIVRVRASFDSKYELTFTEPQIEPVGEE